jgi:hypothetical protein
VPDKCLPTSSILLPEGETMVFHGVNIREPAVLMYEPYNEPTISEENFGNMSWEEWKQINEEIITVIRNNHPSSLMGVAGFNWAYDLTPIKDAPIDASGVPDRNWICAA